jgi:hypothetical protein
MFYSLESYQSEKHVEFTQYKFYKGNRWKNDLIYTDLKKITSTWFAGLRVFLDLSLTYSSHLKNVPRKTQNQTLLMSVPTTEYSHSKHPGGHSNRWEDTQTYSEAM